VILAIINYLLIPARPTATLAAMTSSTTAAGVDAETADSRLRKTLDRGEGITHLVPAIGCVVALTSKRLLIVREGSSFRPKTGVREWEMGPGLTVRAGLVRQGSGSLVIKWGRSATSVFIRADHWDDALALVGTVRARMRLEDGRALGGRRPPGG
jgi:hypothetical protein